MSLYVVQMLSGDDMVFSSHEVVALSPQDAERMALSALGWPVDWDVVDIECVYEDMDTHVMAYVEYLTEDVDCFYF